MANFERIKIARRQVDINIPGFDLSRSVVLAKKRQQRRRSEIAKPAPQAQVTPMDEAQSPVATPGADAEFIQFGASEQDQQDSPADASFDFKL